MLSRNNTILLNILAKRENSKQISLYQLLSSHHSLVFYLLPAPLLLWSLNICHSYLPCYFSGNLLQLKTYRVKLEESCIRIHIRKLNGVPKYNLSILYTLG